MMCNCDFFLTYVCSLIERENDPHVDMESAGKYVRAPMDPDPQTSDDEHEYSEQEEYALSEGNYDIVESDTEKESVMIPSDVSTIQSHELQQIASA